jgi:hypothetical protein
MMSWPFRRYCQCALRFKASASVSPFSRFNLIPHVLNRDSADIKHEFPHADAARTKKSYLFHRQFD